MTRARHIFSTNKHLRYGVPFLTLIVGSTFVIKDLAQLRYDYRKVKNVAMDEAEKYGQMRKKQEEDKGESATNVDKQKTTEQYHEEYMKKDFQEDYTIVSPKTEIRDRT